MIPLGPSRLGATVTYMVVYMNVGTEPLTNAILSFKKSNKINFVNAVPAQSNVIQDTIYWNLGTIQPFEGIKTVLVNCSVKIPPVANINDIVQFISNISVTEADHTPANNCDTTLIRLQSSFDPNDKNESYAGQMPFADYLQGKELNYVIRFQNTGNDTAFNVVIRDTLDASRLDFSSLRMINASHSYQVQVDQGKIKWTFNNINLPDSNVNKPGSKGFISFAIKPKAGLPGGDSFMNTASIYFDFNLPVRTNTASTLIIPPPPVITSFTPFSGGTGTSVIITGSNFTGANTVSFGGTSASSFTVNSSTNITAIVGAGASGSVAVTTPNGTVSMAGFVFIPAPVISSFTPASGGTGVVVTITGSNFTGATAVRFGGTSASSFTVVNATTITAIVAAGATGNVTVVTPGGTTNLAGFVYVSPPAITSFTPPNGPTGTIVTINGTNFTGATAISFGGVAAASFITVNATTITAVVGAGASGDVSVTTPGGTITSPGFIFNVVTAVGGPGNSNSPELLINPNPGSDIIIATHPSSNKQSFIRIIDMKGRTLLVKTVTRGQTTSTIDVSTLAQGLYHLVWTDGIRELQRSLMVGRK
ncbi:MAG: IPT/TIG domain-containing protein [Chitinophagaceae bacterium]|nr:IPT/TIG domain-containing protein [Chitinophagaceae bacterium]